MDVTQSSVMILAVAGAVAAIALLLTDGIKDDLSAILTILLEDAVRSNARRFLPDTEADQLIGWFEGDLDEVREHGGSGIGIALMFLLFTGPYFTWKVLRQKAPKQ